MKSIILVLLLLCGICARDQYTLDVVDTAKHGSVSVIGDSTIRYTHNGEELTGILLDSFSLNATDIRSNVGDATHMYVQVIPFGVQVYIYPQPANLEGITITNNDIPTLNGLISFLFVSTPMEDASISIDNVSGSIKILDNVGNALTDVIEIIEPTSSLRGSIDGVVGYATWDALNKLGRIVGSGSVLAYMDVNVELTINYDTVDNMYGNVTVTKTYLRPVGLKKLR